MSFMDKVKAAAAKIEQFLEAAASRRLALPLCLAILAFGFYAGWKVCHWLQ